MSKKQPGQPPYERLNLAKDLGHRPLGYPSNLCIQKGHLPSPYWYARWDPGKELLQWAGRSGELQSSTRTTDPKEAAKRAVIWQRKKQQELEEKLQQKNTSLEHSLEKYWGIYLDKLSASGLRNLKRRIADEKLKWQNSKGHGVGQQPWSSKCVTELNYQDMAGYWELLEHQFQLGNKAISEKKTLINKLLNIARSTDFPKLQPIVFPTTSTKQDEASYFTKTDWDLLLRTAISLSKGLAIAEVSEQEFKSIELGRRRDSPKNWVYFYDTLCLMEYCLLRAEDLPRIRVSEFSITTDMLNSGNELLTVRLLKTKGDRDKHTCYSYNPNATIFWRRLKRRIPSGYCIFPHIQRKENNEAQSSVLDTFRYLLGLAIRESGISPTDAYGRKYTTTSIRHTAWMNLLTDHPELHTDLPSVAANGMTSEAMLRKTYLRHINKASSVQRILQKREPDSWRLIK